MTFRVVVSGNSGDGFTYRIEQMAAHQEPGMCPFVSRDLVEAGSLAELRRQLEACLEALDRPVLSYEPKLVEHKDWKFD